MVKKSNPSTQKALAKILYWFGATFFVGVVTTVIVLQKMADSSFARETQNLIVIFLSIGIGALCLGIINFSIYFIRQSGLAPQEVKIPGKYYLLIIIFLALLGLSAI